MTNARLLMSFLLEPRSAVRSLLDFMNSPQVAESKRRHGMEPA